MYKNNNSKTAYSWRNATIGINFDIFYDVETNPNALALANNFQAQYTSQAIGPNGIFSTQDLRWYWATHGSRDLSQVWQRHVSPRSADRYMTNT
jgi:hypothetical protein